MRQHSVHRSVILACLVLAFPAGSAAAAPPASPPPAGRADFSGTWKLNEQLSTRPDDVIGKEGTGTGTDARNERARAATAGRRGGSGAGVAETGSFDVLLEALDTVRVIAVSDEGAVVRLTRSNGKKRMLFLDGEDREMDDGEGPATVTARRKGALGERLTVSSKWSTGRSIQETWELTENPRRLTVTTKVSGRYSFTFRRIYDPAPAGVTVESVRPAPTAAPLPAGPAASTAGAEGTAAPAAPAASPVTPAGKKACSIRPPRGTSQADLSAMAKVSKAEAERRAIAQVAPKRPSSVVSSEAEVDEGCLVWTFLLRFAGVQGFQEIAIDAGDGKVLSVETEDR